MSAQPKQTGIQTGRARRVEERAALQRMKIRSALFQSMTVIKASTQQDRTAARPLQARVGG